MWNGCSNTVCWKKHPAKVFTLLSPSMTMTGTEVAGQRCLAGRGLSQFHRTITCTKGKQVKLSHHAEYKTVNSSAYCLYVHLTNSDINLMFNNRAWLSNICADQKPTIRTCFNSEPIFVYSLFMRKTTASSWYCRSIFITATPPTVTWQTCYITVNATSKRADIFMTAVQF